MSYAANLWLFFVLLFGIILVPGMDMLFVLASGLNGGRRPAIAATLGIILGGVFHSLYGVFGAGLIASAVPMLYTVMLVVGGGYMLWIGWTLVRSSITVSEVPLSGPRETRAAFRQGLFTCLMNPKAYLFTMAVFPQYIRPEFGPISRQFVVMALLVAGCQGVIYGAIALGAGKVRTLLTGNPRATAWTGRIAGALLIGVTLLTLWTGFRG
jgi:threonine/homoserine/homoserine lactone efflux protein